MKFITLTSLTMFCLLALPILAQDDPSNVSTGLGPDATSTSDSVDPTGSAPTTDAAEPAATGADDSFTATIGMSANPSNESPSSGNESAPSNESPSPSPGNESAPSNVSAGPSSESAAANNVTSVTSSFNTTSEATRGSTSSTSSRTGVIPSNTGSVAKSGAIPAMGANADQLVFGVVAGVLAAIVL